MMLTIPQERVLKALASQHHWLTPAEIGVAAGGARSMKA
jgi:hypothetical protein